ncbi:hypothetical protein KAFR_0G00860 [Kazachstania africana CBS 2517]|uniref:ESCRT-II complex subunit VPS25 n=1 Tax=Kazachstania africana (strain ATCC 22294 / BCRC 22015 / CBS 2517 / CECT 1963 / NBRC 1671 / NRRL Y-8276) TaxID=1071382 RepID=H2AXL9_KAZAF|nr:hypothetical protein KAFR_0G00860 [Kazachstania africana CBS 2517]CCF59119.1 hypothetical protein KAFR_0G00860 [Kazachstania africana CBS 2517]
MQLEYPPIYSFPPLYTRQPNKIIRTKQIESWITIILDLASKNKLWTISKDGTIENSLNIFQNNDIGRSVPPLFIVEIMKIMFTNGQLVSKSDKKSDFDSDLSNEFYILWKPIESWGSLILEWFETSNKMNQVVTLYELGEGDESIGWEFHEMPAPLLVKSLKNLVSRNRCTLIKDENDKYIAMKVI